MFCLPSTWGMKWKLFQGLSKSFTLQTSRTAGPQDVILSALINKPTFCSNYQEWTLLPSQHPIQKLLQRVTLPQLYQSLVYVLGVNKGYDSVVLYSYRGTERSSQFNHNNKSNWHFLATSMSSHILHIVHLHFAHCK